MDMKCHLRVKDSRKRHISEDNNNAASSRVDDGSSQLESNESGRVDSTKAAEENIVLITIHTKVLSSEDCTNATPSRTEKSCTSTILQQIKDQLKTVHGYTNLEECVFKFRNSRNSFIPLNLLAIKDHASARDPLIVELCNKYSTIKQTQNGSLHDHEPTKSHMSLQREHERASVARNVCKQLNERLKKIEQILPEQPARRNSFLEKEMKNIARRIERFESILNAASEKEWQGMIRRHPLW